MDIGVALPQMARGLDRDRVIAWCHGIDEGPYSSVSAGERITFHNLEGITLCAAAAVLTSRVRVLFNVAVAPWHASALLAKQLATMDVLSNGRMDVAVGVGGRSRTMTRCIRRSIAGTLASTPPFTSCGDCGAAGPAADGSSVGPGPVQPGGPPVFASAMGPRSLRVRGAVGGRRERVRIDS